jgi:hypothetical protein
MSFAKPVWTGLVVGIVVGALFFAFSFITVFGICSDTSFAQATFPYALIADPSLDDRWWLALPMAFIQYPFYGMLCGYVWLHKRSLLWLCILGLFVAHIAAARGAASRLETLHYKLSRQAR